MKFPLPKNVEMHPLVIKTNDPLKYIMKDRSPMVLFMKCTLQTIGTVKTIRRITRILTVLLKLTGSSFEKILGGTGNPNGITEDLKSRG